MTLIQKEQRKLIDAYEQLDPVIKKLVQIVVIWRPVSRTNLVKMAAQAEVKHADGRVPNIKLDRDAINAAIDVGVLNYVSKSNTGPVEAAVLLDDYVFRDAFNTGFAAKVRVLIENQSGQRRQSYNYYAYDQNEIVMRMRFAFYEGDWKVWNELAKRHSFRPYVLDPFCQATFETLSEPLKNDFLGISAITLLSVGDVRRCEVSASAVQLIEGIEKPTDDLIESVAPLLIVQGNIDALEALAKRAKSGFEIEGCVSFLCGDYSAAQKHFELADQQKRKATKKRTTQLAPLTMLLYALLLLKENSAKSLKHAKQIIKAINNRQDIWHFVGIPLAKALEHQPNPLSSKTPVLPGENNVTPFGLLFSG